MVPDAPADVAVFGPIGVGCVHQGKVKRAVAEVDDHQTAAVFEVFDEIGLGRVTQAGFFPIAVIEDDDVVIVEFGFGQELDVGLGGHGHSGIFGQDVLQGLGGFLPVVGGVLVAGDDDGTVGVGLFFGLSIVWGRRGDECFGDGGGDAVGGDFDLGGPEQGVEDHFAKVVDGPVGVEMASGETETSAAVFSLNGPGDDLVFFFAGDGRGQNRRES